MAYDLVIIGSGPGGYSAAVRAGQYGLRTAIVEKDPKLGGTCLHVGCIPTKALLHTAEVWEHFLHPEEDGIECQNARLNLPKVIDRKNKIVSKHAKGVEFLMKKNKVEWLKGYGTLKGGGRVEVRSDKGVETIEAKNIIVATGSEARMLPGLEPDAEFILTNIEILNLQQVPKSLVIIGAGAVGVEFASIFQRFGSKVTVLEMLPRVVPVEDEEVSKELERVFKKAGIRVETGAKADNIRRTGAGIALTVTLANGKKEELEAEKLLVAVGRKPNTGKIGLENTRIEQDRGFLVVDQWQQTAEPGVYAIGDVVAGTPQLAHVATMEGMIAVAHMAGKPTRPLQRQRIPGATYTEPGIGSVGLTEAQARAAGNKVKVGKFPFAANSKATILGRHDGFVKVVSDEKYGEILGVHIIGPSAYELIAEAVTAMEAEATVETMMATIHAHPTLYEAIGEAFQSVYGLAINA
ncbi:MAG: dihydrolipoyl dehydrogenase [Bryobacteraceae bacterium]